MAINFQQLAANPLLHFGLGMLGGNVGASRGAALANAMQGGLLGFQQGTQLQRQMAQTQLQQQQFEAEEAQRALEEQRMQERQQAGLGLLGQAGISPEQEAYYSTFEDPYAQYLTEQPEPIKPMIVGRDVIDPVTQELLYRAPPGTPTVQITQGQMKPSERVNAALNLQKSGAVDTFEQGLAVVDQTTGAPTTIAQDVQQGIAQEATGARRPPTTLTAQQREIKKNMITADKEGVTGMQRADMARDQATDLIGKIDSALDILPNIKTGVLWGSDIGQAVQSAVSEDASEFFNILNQLATMEKVDMIGATGAKAFDSEKEAQQLMKGLISGTLKPGVIEKKLKSLKNKFNKSLRNYDNVKRYATEKAGVDWLSGENGQQKTVVSTRTTPDGRTMVEYSDGTLGFQQ